MHPADMIFYWATTDPERLAIIQPGMAVTYRALAKAVTAVSQRIARYKLDASEPVAVSIHNPAWQLIVSFALLRKGLTAVPVARGTLPFLRPNGISDIIYAGEGQMLSGGRNIRFEESWLRHDDNSATVWDPTSPSHADRADLIFFTSGTTGTPKKMVVPSGALMERVAVLPIIGDANFGRTLIVPNLVSSFSFMRAALILYAGKTACFAAGFDQQLAVINMFRIEQLVASAQQVFDLVTFLEQGGKGQLLSLKDVWIGGGYVSGDLVKRIQARLCRNVTVGYSATEAARIAFANYDMIAHIPNAVGFVVPGVQVEIVDEDNQHLPNGQEGIVRSRTNYYAKVFAANNPDRAAEAADMWWYPGDRGSLTADGVLCITGRADDVINCGGVKVSGTILDDAVRGYPGVKDAAVCGVRGPSGIEEIWIGLVSEGTVDVAGLKKWVEASQESVVVGKVFMLDKIPRNALGKLQRHLLKNGLVEGV
jgi:acyl-coenzyme A synthetase/AMP-(fatty) acid ligase